jgi:hypothetical protein
VPDNCSPMPITREQAKGFRLGGYFAFFVAFLSAINWISAIRNDYVIEHHWPAASATVYSIREDSREVSPPSSRQHSYWVYWVEFIVVLDFPRPMPGANHSFNRATRSVQRRSQDSGSKVSWRRAGLVYPASARVKIDYSLRPADPADSAGERIGL